MSKTSDISVRICTPLTEPLSHCYIIITVCVSASADALSFSNVCISMTSVISPLPMLSIVLTVFLFAFLFSLFTFIEMCRADKIAFALRHPARMHSPIQLRTYEYNHAHVLVPCYKFMTESHIVGAWSGARKLQHVYGDILQAA